MFLYEVMALEEIYTDTAKILKVLSEPKRLRIIDMLSCGELCACQILEAFQVTQPTLSHDMKLLVDTGIVKDRREGKNIYYSLDQNVLNGLIYNLSGMVRTKQECICYYKLEPKCN